MTGNSSGWEKAEKAAKLLGLELTPECYVQTFCRPFREQLEH
jgi:hypothetical protein